MKDINQEFRLLEQELNRMNEKKNAIENELKNNADWMLEESLKQLTLKIEGYEKKLKLLKPSDITEVKKQFQKMYKEYNKINDTNIKGNFKIKSKDALISFGTYRIEDGMIQNKCTGEDEQGHEQNIEELRNKFLSSEQFKNFIKINNVIYIKEDNISWQVHEVTIKTKQIRLQFK